MGTTAQLYNLGWSEFDSCLKRAVRSLHTSGDLVDVTLVAGGKTFPAHKLILSAASPLLLELLKVTPCNHPVILLAGISASDLESLLEFVYSGEVSVHPSELPSLLQAAHVLNIFGLVQGTIAAEKPEIRNAAAAALEASIEASQKLNQATLAAATNAGLVAAAQSGNLIRRKRKVKHKDSDNGDNHDKWTTCDSSDDSSDSESCAKTLRSGSAGGNSPTSASSLSQTIQQVVQSNAPAPTESASKSQKPSLGSLSSLSVNSASCVKSAMLKIENSLLIGQVNNQSSVQQDVSDGHDPALVPPHLLADDENPPHSGDESCMLGCARSLALDRSTRALTLDPVADAAIAAAADAAALAASTLADKKGISEQPAACPLCSAIIRQSRNLRRHLELKHFGKRPKKGKGGKRKPRLKQCDTDTESNAGSVADTTVIEHVQVEMKSPSVCGTVPPSGSSSPTPTPPPKHHTLTELQPAHQHQNVEVFLQQQQQLQQLQMDQFPHHMAPPTSNSTYQIPYPHPHPHLSVLRGDPHASLMGGDALAFRAHSTPQTFSAIYSESSRSSNHQ